jgi:hypothetical protein
MKTVTLSTKEVVTLGPWKRKAAKVFHQTINKNVFYMQNIESGKIDQVKKIPVENYDAAYEAVMPILVDRIEKDGGTLPFSQGWLDDLEERDYDALEAAVSELKLSAREAGEKNPGTTAKAS